MEHYFISKEHSKDDYFEFEQSFGNKTFVFKSCSDIFSKDRLDYGTKTLICTVLKNFELFGDVLDIGCGKGEIGIILASFNNKASFVMSDINKTAVELTRENIQKNNITNVAQVVLCDGYQSINQTFDFIITNPPIKAGKQNLLNILTNAHNHLKANGKLVFVIKKKHGEDSVKKHLEQVFSSVEILNRDSGYYILSCTK